MNIRIVKKSGCLKGIILNNGLLMETVYSSSKYENINSVQYFFYDCENNTKEEMLPGIEKYEVFKIKNMKKTSLEIFYTTIEELENGKVRITLNKFNIEKQESSHIYSYDDEIVQYTDYKRIRIFILNEFYILVQNEYIRYNLTETYKDYLEFEQFLLSVKDQKLIPVLDENLKRNGIERIKTISENLCVIKTGFSLMKDKRYSILDKNEVSVEGISFVNLSQLVSDIILGQKNIAFDTIDQAYYTDTFSYISVKEKYIVYSKVKTKTHEEEVVFYNYEKKESKICINQNVYEEKDLARTFIISKTPYIKIENDKGTSFFNLEKNKFDITFENNVKIETVLNNLFIVTKEKKKLIGKDTSYIYVYQYPEMKLLLKEKSRYCGKMKSNKGDLYIFTD